MFKKIIVLTIISTNLSYSFDESFGYSGKTIRGQSFDNLKKEYLKKKELNNSEEFKKYDRENANSKDVQFNKRRSSIEASLQIIYPEKKTKYILSNYWREEITKEMLYYTITGKDFEKSKYKNKPIEDFYNFVRKELKEIFTLQNKKFDCCNVPSAVLNFQVESYIERLKELEELKNSPVPEDTREFLTLEDVDPYRS